MTVQQVEVYRAFRRWRIRLMVTTIIVAAKVTNKARKIIIRSGASARNKELAIAIRFRADQPARSWHEIRHDCHQLEFYWQLTNAATITTESDHWSQVPNAAKNRQAREWEWKSESNGITKAEGGTAKDVLSLSEGLGILLLKVNLAPNCSNSNHTVDNLWITDANLFTASYLTKMNHAQNIMDFIQFCNGILQSSRALRQQPGPDFLDLEMTLLRLEMIWR